MQDFHGSSYRIQGSASSVSCISGLAETRGVKLSGRTRSLRPQLPNFTSCSSLREDPWQDTTGQRLKDALTYWIGPLVDRPSVAIQSHCLELKPAFQ